MRFKINGIVTIPAGLFGAGEVLIDSPEFEVTQGRQADGTAYIGVTYYFMQGSVPQTYFVEYPRLFTELSAPEQQVIGELITKAVEHTLTMPQHKGAVAI